MSLVCTCCECAHTGPTTANKEDRNQREKLRAKPLGRMLEYPSMVEELMAARLRNLASDYSDVHTP